jgi:hypothetical protein
LGHGWKGQTDGSASDDIVVVLARLLPKTLVGVLLLRPTEESDNDVDATIVHREVRGELANHDAQPWRLAREIQDHG